MSEVINIKNRPVFLRWTFANVWIRGEELELATCDETGQPMVIHWKSGRAWFGDWCDLVGPVALQLLGVVSDGD